MRSSSQARVKDASMSSIALASPTSCDEGDGYLTCHAIYPFQQRLNNCLNQGVLWQV
jgi:hypothetical protein